MRKKLTKKQKAINKKGYKRIREKYNQLKKEERLYITQPNGKKKVMTYIQFKRRVRLRQKEEDLSFKEAIKKEVNSRTFTSPEERSKTNLLNAMKEDFKSEYDKLSKLRYQFRDEKGKLKSIKASMEWDEEKKKYIVDGRYLIDVTNSPKQVIITDMQTGATL